ncbi:MAG: SsrA-binding protein SmpB [Bacilli bacterium]
MKAESLPNEKLIASNRKAHFNYFLSEFQEAGIELVGSEIKALRMGHCSIDDSYVIIKNCQAYILNMNIPLFQENGIFSHDPVRTRKLLLHKSQILKLDQAVAREGYSIIPARVYLKKGMCKVQIALGKGKKNWDKRQAIKDREDKINMAKAIKKSY